MEPIIIYVADNHYLSFLGLSSLFHSYYGAHVVVEQVVNKAILEFKISQAKPNFIVVDYANFDGGGVFDVYAIKKMAPETVVLVISDNQDKKSIKEVVNAGISHYLLKSASQDEFVNALKAIQKGGKFISGDLYDILLQKEKRSYDIYAENHKLTISEIEVVKLIANGKTTKEIADIKNLSFHTVNTHRKNIFRKLAITNSSELVRYAVNMGLMNDLDYYI